MRPCSAPADTNCGRVMSSPPPRSARIAHAEEKGNASVARARRTTHSAFPCDRTVSYNPAAESQAISTLGHAPTSSVPNVVTRHPPTSPVRRENVPLRAAGLVVRSVRNRAAPTSRRSARKAPGISASVAATPGAAVGSVPMSTTADAAVAKPTRRGGDCHGLGIAPCAPEVTTSVVPATSGVAAVAGAAPFASATTGAGALAGDRPLASETTGAGALAGAGPLASETTGAGALAGAGPLASETTGVAAVAGARLLPSAARRAIPRESRGKASARIRAVAAARAAHDSAVTLRRPGPPTPVVWRLTRQTPDFSRLTSACARRYASPRTLTSDRSRSTSCWTCAASGHESGATHSTTTWPGASDARASADAHAAANATANARRRRQRAYPVPSAVRATRRMYRDSAGRGTNVVRIPISGGAHRLAAVGSHPWCTRLILVR
jgi:hypothetical protein